MFPGISHAPNKTCLVMGTSSFLSIVSFAVVFSCVFFVFSGPGSVVETRRPVLHRHANICSRVQLPQHCSQKNSIGLVGTCKLEQVLSYGQGIALLTDLVTLYVKLLLYNLSSSLQSLQIGCNDKFLPCTYVYTTNSFMMNSIYLFYPQRFDSVLGLLSIELVLVLPRLAFVWSVVESKVKTSLWAWFYYSLTELGLKWKWSG